jgi:hypothetical protein
MTTFPGLSSSYPQADTSNLRFVHTTAPDDQRGIHEVFKRRLAAYFARYCPGQVISIQSGLRSYAKQKGLYDEWVAQGSPSGAPVAAPGRSRHECGLAVDIGSVNGPGFTCNGRWYKNYPATMDADFKQGAAHERKKLAEYGLCQEVHSSEPWHLVPMEVIGYATPDLIAWFTGGSADTSAVDDTDTSHVISTTASAEEDSEDIAPKDWKVYYSGKYGVKSTLYLEKVKNLEIQTKRQEAIESAKAKAELSEESVGPLDETADYVGDYNTHIDKWETILNSTPGYSSLSPKDTLLTSKTTAYPIREIGMTRVIYLSALLDELNGNKAVFNNQNYATILNHPILKDLCSVCSFDQADPWAGYARKDLLFYLYCLILELESQCNKKGEKYNKLSVSLCRYNETQKVLGDRQMEHYVGLAADLYLPKVNEGVTILTSANVANTLYSMGVHYIGIGQDFVHFDLAGDDGKSWTIGGYTASNLQLIDLNMTKSLAIPKEFK